MPRKTKAKVTVDEVAEKILGAQNVALIKSIAQDFAREARQVQNEYWDKIRHLPYEPPVWKRGPAVHSMEDLAQVPLTQEYLVTSGKARNLSRLAEFPRLEYLEIDRANDKALEHLRGLNNIVSLNLRLGTYTNLSWSENMSGLRDLFLDHNVKLTSLAGLEKLSGLRTLELKGLRRLRSIEPVLSLTGLIGLAILCGHTGGMSDEMHVDSVRPLTALTNLRMLNLRGTEPIDCDFTPIASMPNLEKISLWPNFEIKQMALLAAKFPSLFEEWSKPLMESPRQCRKCGEKKLRIIGPEIPVWCPVCDKPKIDERLSTFARLAKEYRSVKALSV